MGVKFSALRLLTAVLPSNTRDDATPPLISAAYANESFKTPLYPTIQQVVGLQEALDALIPAGVIAPFAGSAVPTGWLLCDGSAVSRTGANARLFTAISTTYGAGNGTTTFNVPEGRGRSAIGAGTGPGLSARTLGQVLGAESVALTDPLMNAVHTHTAASGTTPASNTETSSGFPATGNDASETITAGAIPITIGNSGGSLAHNNMQPSFVTNWIIKL